MNFSYLVMFYDNSSSNNQIDKADLRGISQVVSAAPDLLKAKLYMPESIHDYHNDVPPPRFALQLYFDDLEKLEASIGKKGHLQALAAPDAWPSLAGTHVTQQVMVVRPYLMSDSEPIPEKVSCSYLVHYPGYAQDFNAWLNNYLSHHPQTMGCYPGVREIEILTRVDWCDAMPWQRVNYMQRNKLVFDSPEALSEALYSSVRHKMRSDYKKFPAFEGGSVHFPMSTITIFPEQIGQG